MQIDDEREWSLSPRLIQVREQRLVPMPDIFNILDIDFVVGKYGGVHDELLWGIKVTRS